MKRIILVASTLFVGVTFLMSGFETKVAEASECLAHEETSQFEYASGSTHFYGRFINNCGETVYVQWVFDDPNCSRGLSRIDAGETHGTSVLAPPHVSVVRIHYTWGDYYGPQSPCP